MKSDEFSTIITTFANILLLWKWNIKQKHNKTNKNDNNFGQLLNEQNQNDEEKSIEWREIGGVL